MKTKTEKKVPCPVCNHTGHMVIRGQLLTPRGFVKQKPVTIDCIWCTGGYMTEDQQMAYTAYKDAWCKCGNPSGLTKAWADGENPACYKHNWTCRDCGKLLQVG